MLHPIVHHPTSATEGGPSADFVFNYRRTTIPKVLSRRYQHSIHLLQPAAEPAAPSAHMPSNRAQKASAPNGGDSSEPSDDEGHSPPPAATRKTRADTATRPRTAGGVPPAGTTSLGSAHAPRAGAAAVTATRPPGSKHPRQRSASHSPALPPVHPYTPFPLHPTSSFATGSSHGFSRRFRSAPQIAAKYAAYVQPPADVTQMIERSDQRARAVERVSRDAFAKQVEDARRRFGRREEKEKVGWQMAELARERMKNKFARAMALRESQVQYLVEGQQNSIDAILLKEHLALRPRLRVNMRKVYTDDDRIRVDRIIAG